jgi:hypothetical protein
VYEGQVKQIWPLFGEQIKQADEQTEQTVLELFEGLTRLPVQLGQVPLLKKVFRRQVTQIDPLFDEHVAQTEEQTMHERFEFP